MSLRKPAYCVRQVNTEDLLVYASLVTKGSSVQFVGLKPAITAPQGITALEAYRRVQNAPQVLILQTRQMLGIASRLPTSSSRHFL